MQGQQKFKTRSKILPRKIAMQLLQHTGLFSSPFLLHLVTIQELLMVRQQSIGAKCGERYHFHFSWLLSLEVSSGSGTRCGAWWFSDTQGQGHSPLQRGSLGAYNLLVPSEIEQACQPSPDHVAAVTTAFGTLLFWELLPGKVKKFIIFSMWKCHHIFLPITWPRLSCGGDLSTYCRDWWNISKKIETGWQVPLAD